MLNPQHSRNQVAGRKGLCYEPVWPVGLYCIVPCCHPDRNTGGKEHGENFSTMLADSQSNAELQDLNIGVTVVVW